MISRRLASDLARSFPGSAYIPRGKQSLDSLAKKCYSKGFSRLCIVQESHGNPSAFAFFGTAGEKLERLGEFNAKVIKTRSSFAKNREKFNALSFSVSSDGAKTFMQETLAENSAGAQLEMREYAGHLSFFCRGSEIGPVFSVARKAETT